MNRTLAGLTIALSLGSVRVPSTSALASPVPVSQQQQWQYYAEVAFRASGDGDWDTSIINLNRAIREAPQCLAGYYREVLKVAQDSKKLRSEGVSNKAVYQRYSTQVVAIVEDCWE